MAGYGYTYRTVATYNTVREESRSRGPVIKPFVPFVPNTNTNSDGYVTQKKIVPVASRPPYDDDDDDGDYRRHSSPSDEWHRQKSPVRSSPRKVDEFLTKVQDEASRPQRFSPMASTDWCQPTSYNSPNGYGDYGGNKEGRKPIGSTIRNDNYDGPNGYGGFGDHNNGEGLKPSSNPLRNGKYDGYDGANNGYGGYGSYNNKEGHKPTSNPIWNDRYDDYDGANNGYGGYGNKEGRRPFGSTTRNDKYDGYEGGNGYGDYGNYNNKEGHKPSSSPVRNDKYDGYDGANNGYGGGYGNYNNKEGHRPYGSSPRSDKYDGYNGGNGYGNYNNKEGHKPSSSPTRNDNYDRLRPAENYRAMEPNRNILGGLTKPKVSTAWTAPPRKGTQLSEPTSDIGKAMELLKEAAKVTPDDHSNKGGHKLSNNWAATLGNDSQPRSKFDKGKDLVKGAERLKNIVTGAPQSRFSVPKSATPNKDDYGETIDRRDATSRYGNLNFSSRPHTPPTPTHVTFIDGREPDYKENFGRRDDSRSYGKALGPIIDSRYAEKKFGGRKI